MDTPPPPDPTATATATATATIATTTVNNRDQFLRHLTNLNKLSHKISKPPHHRPSPPPPPHQPPHPPPQQPPPHPQPPVYNISKTDFRDVVQKLTGSPSHPPPPPPPPSQSAAAAKPNSSRLQRIRPPPLAQLITRPPSPLVNSRFGSGSGFGPMSPLPPLPSCHGAAESPISAYMRLINSFPPPENVENFPPSQGDPPLSPLGFGCLQSPKLMMPPLSPTVPGVPSPK